MPATVEASFQPSPWPLPAGGRRALISAEAISWMAQDARTSALHPHGFGFYPHASGHQMSRQQHRDDLVIYCVEGAGQCDVSGSRHPVQAGDLLVLPAGLQHRYRAARRNPWSIFWMHLGGSAIADWLAPFTQHGPVTHISLHERLVHDFRTLLESTSTGYRADNLLLAASLCQQIMASAVVLVNRQPDDDDAALQRLHAFMDTHLDQRLTLDDLVRVSGTQSRYQFIRQYKQRTGQTPMQAFTHRKMSHACYLLETTDTTVAVVARTLGFDDPYYFSRAFSRVAGVSPAQYRARNRA